VNCVKKKNNSVIFHQEITQTFNVDYKVPGRLKGCHLIIKMSLVFAGCNYDKEFV